MGTQFWNRSALELAALVARGEVSALEVVDDHFRRIAAVNPSVNAITNVLSDSARQAARETDRRRAAGEALGPLAGVPFTVKENLDVAGSATTHGLASPGRGERRRVATTTNAPPSRSGSSRGVFGAGGSLG